MEDGAHNKHFADQSQGCSNVWLWEDLSRYSDNLNRKQHRGAYLCHIILQGMIVFMKIAQSWKSPWLNRLKRDGPQAQNVGPTREDALWDPREDHLHCPKHLPRNVLQSCALRPNIRKF